MAKDKKPAKPAKSAKPVNSAKPQAKKPGQEKLRTLHFSRKKAEADANKEKEDPPPPNIGKTIVKKADTEETKD